MEILLYTEASIAELEESGFDVSGRVATDTELTEGKTKFNGIPYRCLQFDCCLRMFYFSFVTHGDKTITRGANGVRLLLESLCAAHFYWMRVEFGDHGSRVKKADYAWGRAKIRYVGRGWFIATSPDLRSLLRFEQLVRRGKIEPILGTEVSGRPIEVSGRPIVKAKRRGPIHRLVSRIFSILAGA
ncbi:MAG: hypothetical protein COT91_03940 [Candidatus Doudnabacteria bacterium CG10_big_fil_rev_8_21_14_0_10_41_10]|uniref:Uncharacterized protein n=1 Tax=Candidatus Doudnabacteria bacterium CG10_big_fil_rev_8_21_14_0_10_41_10 TaxID=1974551 RepID=A0A2H0VD07_9BACT|nr:MAG: hypothetical protein COT91_03940 [Candidatus Doudnabacteria bacterium CG10_big_fil_rev_8_21_14_0_10_41_10]